MKLAITTPFSIAVDQSDVALIEAEDATGRFGVLPHHADLLAVLVPSVIHWQAADGRHGYCAVHGGILTVQDGNVVSVSSREAVPGDDLEKLESDILARFARRHAEELAARVATERMMLSAMRQIMSFVRPARAQRH
jgi:F-type H+-transporting ATPase subunit epsilon